MNSLQDQVKSSIIKSLLPLTLGIALHLSNHYCLKFFLEDQLIEFLAEKLLHSYTNFLSFILLMILITIITMNTKTLSSQPIGKNIFRRIIIYCFIYCCYQIIFSLFPIPRSIKSAFNNLNITTQDSRLLEEEAMLNLQYPTSLSINNTLQPEEFYLAVGQLITVLNVNAMATAVSKDKKYIYALHPDQFLKIIDISNIKAPVVISSLRFDPTMVFLDLTAIYLAEDGETLFASNFNRLHILNVSNPESPFLLASITDPHNFLDSMTPRPLLYQPIIQISQDEKTLFLAGIGLKIFDISNISEPTEIFSSMSRTKFTSSSLALSVNNPYLLYVNEKFLKTYNISDPKNPTEMNSFPMIASATSMILTQDKRTAYIICLDSATKKTYMEKIDVLDPLNPSRIKNSQLNFTSLDSPVILGMSPCYRYILISRVTDRQGSTELRVFDTINERIISSEGNTLESASALTFIPGTNYLVTGSSNFGLRMTFFQFYPDFLCRKNFRNSENPLDTELFLQKLSTSLRFSKDFQIIFVSTGQSRYDLNDRYRPKINGNLEIINASSKATLSSYTTNSPIWDVYISEDSTRAVARLVNGIQVLDISNLSTPFLLRSLNLSNLASRDDFEDWFVSKDANIIILALRNDPFREDNTQMHAVRVYNASGVSPIASLPFNTSVSDFKMVLSKDEKILFLVHSQLVIYDLSDIKSPKILANISVPENARLRNIFSCQLSPDEKILAVRSGDTSFFSKLKFFDVSNKAQPIYLSEIGVPFSSADPLPLRDPIFSSDQKTIYTVQEESLLAIDISNLTNPQAFGVVPNLPRSGVTHISTDPDRKTANILTHNGNWYRRRLQPPEILYLKQETFKLGEKYMDRLFIIKNNEASDYHILPTNSYKLIKSRFLEVQRTEDYVTVAKINSSPLPHWMSVDTQNNLLTLEPKSQSDIQPYTLCSNFSLKIPQKAFEVLGPLLPNSTNSRELIATLISLGYIDNQLFLTSNFGEIDDFFLPNLLQDLEEEIYQFLRTYYRETCTRFEVISSLEFESTADNKFSIKTLSSSPIKVSIEVESTNRFLSKSYGLIQPIVSRGGSSITFEGYQSEINQVLRDLVVDLAISHEPCSGTIKIDDHLNPLVIRTINNISQYFNKNQKPALNSNETLFIQNQIDQVPLYTGQYFAININEDTFIDNHTDKLSYSVVPNNSQAVNLPLWMTFHYPFLKGTPPEDLFNRDIDLKIIVKNEFKQLEIPFRLHINISLTFALKLLAKNSPYIITLLGFIIYANRIYNILFKRHYKHPKEYFINCGENITPSVIFPVMFVAGENREKKLIWKYFLQNVTTKLGSKRTPNKCQIVDYFIDQATGKLDKTKISQTIQEAVSQMPNHEQKKLHLYNMPKDETRKTLILQLFVNTLTEWQLNLKQESETQKIFNQIKSRCYDFVEYTPSFQFIINQKALQQGLDAPILLEDIEQHERLLNQNTLNIDLLQNAIVSLVFKCQSLDLYPIHSNVEIKESCQRNFLFRFFKKDLKDIHVIDYGLSCKIQNSVLLFSGTIAKDASEVIIVVQISTHRQRILKEIWIHGQSDNLNINKSSFNNNYEIL